MADAFEFSWKMLPRKLLLGIAWATKLDMDHAPASIAERFGDLPTSDLIRAAAPVLVDRWLLDDPGALKAVQSIIGESVDDRDLATALAASEQACEAASYRLFLRGLEASGDVFEGQENPWVGNDVLDPDYTVTNLQRQLRELLRVDEEWVVIDGDNWTWWPSATPIYITVGPARSVLGDTAYRIRARCPIVRNVPSLDAESTERLTWFNSDANMFAVIHDPERSEISACCAYTAHEGNELVSRVFSGALVMMANFGVSVHEMAEMFKGEAVLTPHPRSGLRRDFDELAFFVNDFIEPRKDEPSQFRDEVEGLDFSGWPGYALQVTDDVRLGKAQSELAFYNDLPAIASHELGWAVGTSLAQFDGGADEGLFGHGLLGKLFIPDLESFPPDYASFAAQLLNRKEAYEDTGFAFFGAWFATPREQSETNRFDLAFRQFIPNPFYLEDIATFFAWTMTFRNWWLVRWREVQEKNIGSASDFDPPVA